MTISLRKLSSFFFRKHSRLIAEINSNAMMVEWHKERAIANIFPHRFDLYQHVYNAHCGKNIDYIEFGVWWGETLFKWAEMNADEQSRFFGFDSFEGLPEAWDCIRSPTLPKGSFSASGQIPETTDERIRFVKGLFQDTLHSFRREYTPQNPLVIHVDCDIYSSSLYCLTQMDELIIPGTLVLFDEFMFFT